MCLLGMLIVSLCCCRALGLVCFFVVLAVALHLSLYLTGGKKVCPLCATLICIVIASLLLTLVAVQGNYRGLVGMRAPFAGVP